MREFGRGIWSALRLLGPLGPLGAAGAAGAAGMAGAVVGAAACNYAELGLLDQTSLAVPSGAYYRSYDVSGDGQQGERAAPASVGGFSLDQYEVTVNRFREFVEDGRGLQATAPASLAGAHAKIPGSGWNPAWNAQLAASRDGLLTRLNCNSAFQTWTDSPGDNERRPMNCISWYEAMAFCIWDGGYLPTEAEWNYAAAGGNEHRAYPWSNPPESLTLNQTFASYKEGTACNGDGKGECSRGDLLAVGTRPEGDGRWGHSDLAGNVWEWNLDLQGPYEPSCVDCAVLAGAGLDRRIIRGGGFSAEARFQRTGVRSGLVPAARYDFTGVRCARP